MRGARRVQARKLIQSLAYDGAKSGRRTEGWITTAASADAETQAAVLALRERARDLVRNNPYAARAIDVKVANTIGAGIVAEVGSKKLAKRWDVFVDTCDADGCNDLYGVQALIERCRVESGECLVRRVPSSMVTGGVAMQVRVLEPDYLDATRDGKAPDSDNLVRQGIEYDRAGRVVAYWLYPEHPGDAWSIVNLRARGFTSRRIDAADVIHVYRKLRPGQTRGVTDFAPVMMRMRDLDDYDDAEVMRKKIEACLATFVTTPAGIDTTSLGALSTDEKGRVESLFPGMIKYLAPGEGVTMSDPKASGGYAEFQRFGLRAIASGVGVPYELMTGDLSQVNYSSYRAGLVDFRRRLEQDQWHLYVPRVCDRIAGWFQEEVSNVTPGMGERTDFEWTPPRFELIDPLKETQAEIEACQAGFDTWEEIVRRRGWTAEEQLDEIEEWQKELTTRGIVVKSDYRNEIAAKATPGPVPVPDAPDPEDGEDTTPPAEEKMSRKVIQRDARGRISAIVETGAVVERDEQGHIKAILEVA